MPRTPVVSRKSGLFQRTSNRGKIKLIIIGNIFERSLIEAYIQENGKDPVNNEDLSLDDLLELKSPRIVRPKPPTYTSIPSLLSVFQNEWDAVALETYTLKQNLTKTRQELSTALYQNDAAVRVITRLSRERDEARDALARITINGATASNGDAMQVDRQALSSTLVAEIEATQERWAIFLCSLPNTEVALANCYRLSKTRRKRTVPDDWVTSDIIQSFKTIGKSSPLHCSARSMPLDPSGDLALVGGANGVAGVYSVSQQKVVHELMVGSGAITDALWVGGRAVFAMSSGHVKIFEKGVEVSSFKGHSREITALAVHPSKHILASVGVDKSYIFYDLTSLRQAVQVYTDSGKHSTMQSPRSTANASTVLTTAEFHPDGHLFAAGGADGQIKVYDAKSGAHAANFDVSGPLQDLSFSENGTWLAAVSKGSTSVSIWDLRKSAQIKVLEVGGQVERVRWDYTGQFLAIAGPSGLAIQQYSKSSKEWSEPLRSSVPAVAVEWRPRAQSVVTLGADGAVTILGSE